MDLGRPPLARFPAGDMVLSPDPISSEDLQAAVDQVTPPPLWGTNCSARLWACVNGTAAGVPGGSVRPHERRTAAPPVPLHPRRWAWCGLRDARDRCGHYASTRAVAASRRDDCS